MSHLIDPADMEELTGAKAPGKQCEVLRKNGLRFTVRADGRPSLSWEAYNRQMVTEVRQEHSGPNLQAI